MDYIEAFNPRSTAFAVTDTIPIPINMSVESLIAVDSTKNGLQLLTHDIIPTFNPFWYLVASIALLAIISNLFFKQYKGYLIEYFVPRLGNKNYEREERLGLITRLLNLFFILNFSLFIYKISEISSWIMPYESPNQRFIFVFLILLAAWHAKTIITLLTHALFSGWKMGFTLLSISQQAEFIMTIVLIPINFIIYYNPQSILLLGITIGILFIILFFGIFKLFLELRQNSSYFNYQIIIYLCTLELLPIMVLIKYYAF